MKIFRWKAIVPLSIFLVIFALVWLLMLDGLVRDGIEFAGGQITGARVDVESADVKPFSGRVVINGLQAADPNAPMTNMVEAEEIIADIQIAPLLQKKIVIDTLAVRGLRFGTSRTESGELEKKGETTGAVAGRITEWAGALAVPEFSLSGLSQAVNVDEIDTENLATVKLARGITADADSLRDKWTGDIRSLDARAEIDTARALAERIGNINLRNLSLRRINQIKDTVTSARNFIRDVERKRDSIRDLGNSFEGGLQYLREQVALLDDMRDIDYSYARGLLKIPSIEAPDIGPALFGEMAKEQIEPVLRVLEKIDEYAPPGLKIRKESGPERLRMAGTSVHFPREKSYPELLLEFGDISLILGSESRPEQYSLTVHGLNSDPAVYGQPTTFSFERVSGGAGDRMITATGLIDHTGSILKDSLELTLSGAGMGDVSMGSLGGRLDLGTGTSSVRMDRTGEDFDFSLRWECPGVSWESTREKSGVEEFVWNTLSRLRSVSVSMSMKRTPAGVDLSVTSNVAGELSNALQRQLGDEIRRAEARVRNEVDRRIAAVEAAARREVDRVRSEVEERISELQDELDQARAELESKLKGVIDRLPAGIIPPY